MSPGEVNMRIFNQRLWYPHEPLQFFIACVYTPCFRTCSLAVKVTTRWLQQNTFVTVNLSFSVGHLKTALVTLFICCDRSAEEEEHLFKHWALNW